MTHGSLFSGIGGFDLAAEWAGWENVFHCEWNPFGQQVLKHHFPNSISYGDITKTDFSIHRGNIDILTGGFPCQPYSQAGKRLGKEDERHLWPHMRRAIQEVSPKWVVGENVRGITTWNGGLVFNEVQTDLEAEGYKVLPFLLPASGVNAPHERYRIWIVAYNNSFRSKCRTSNCDIKAKREAIRSNIQFEIDRSCSQRLIANPSGNRWERERKEIEIENRKSESGIEGIMEGRLKGLRSDADATNANETRLQGSELNGAFDQGKEREQAFRPVAEFFESYNVANTDAARQWRNERKSKSEGNIWEQFPTQPPVCGRNDGIPAGLAGITVSKHRNESIKAYGNAIVPQVVYQIFKAINEYESLILPQQL